MANSSPTNVPRPISASFEKSLVPMVVADDARRFVAANAAACLLLRLRPEEVVTRAIDDLTPPEGRAQLPSLWDAFLSEGMQRGTFELLMPDGPRMRVDYSAKANIEPGRHLSIFLVPMVEPGAWFDEQAIGAQMLTGRERQVLALIAMGESGAAIAGALGISQTTVETHVRNCLSKLGARNRAHAIALGLLHGEIDLNLRS